MQSFSQDGQDKFIADLFNNKKEGIFLDIGAYNGLDFSNTLYLEKNLLWKGICIEPNPVVFEKLKINRNCICLNCCVSEVKGTFQFLSVSGYGIMLSGLIDMYDEKHLERINETIRNHGGNKEILNVPALPLKNILEEFDFKTIDYCNIDVEGGELSVLKSIDFSKILIKFFTIENNYGSKTIGSFLKLHGYKLIATLGSDEVYEYHSKRYSLIFSLKLKRIRNHINIIKQVIKTKIRLTI
jgi:FkbM family methyltransferase